jgi:hypothetical protein
MAVLGAVEDNGPTNTARSSRAKVCRKKAH